MANWNNIKGLIRTNVYENTAEEITGTKLQNVLIAMVDQLVGSGYIWQGFMTPESVVPTPDGRVFYFAITSGTYPVGEIVLSGSEIGAIYYDTSWHITKISVLTQQNLEEALVIALQNYYTKTQTESKISEATTPLGTRLTAAEGNITSLGGRVTTAEGDIDTIEGKIPAQATSANQLADKAFVNSSINSVTAYYITSNPAGDAFATKAALLAGPYYNQGQLRTPTRNDYALVIADETKDNASVRYVFDGTNWAYQYKVNDTPFTASQLAAINSGATSAIIGSVAGKYVKPATGIPSTDMTAEVQTSLGKADTALQEHQSLAAYRTSALQDVIDAGKANKPTSEVFSVSSWSDLASADPFAKQATLTAQHTIGANTIVELINNNAVAFANYGFQIGAVSGQSITLYAIEAPTSAVNITINFTD